MKNYLNFTLFFFICLISNAQKMKIPPYLKKGDTVAIVCTARKFFTDEAKPAIDLLKSWGLETKLGSSVGLDNFQLGGTDEERAKDLQTQLDNPNIKAIWCARGGYGSVRIIDMLNFDNFLKNPKWIMGFSDVTVLHSHLNSLGVASLHSIMPFSIPKAPEDIKETLRKSLFGEKNTYTAPSNPNNILGSAKGEIVGGNLSILYSLLGSTSSINTENKILFIEDLDEYLYHIDRMMYNLKRNGYLKNVKGIIVGTMRDMHDNEIPFGQNATQIIKAITADLNIPIAFDFPAGHQRDNKTLMLGAQVNFSVTDKEVVLKFE
jgi:muramoyltetrapeptide carboxypeptidase